MAHEKKEYIEIKKIHLDKLRENPWIISTIVLVILLVVVLVVLLLSQGNALSPSAAGQRVVDFINTHGQAKITFISADKYDSFYKVVIGYQGQQVPLLVTTDGRYLINNPIPLFNNSNTSVSNAVNIDSGTSPREGNNNSKVMVIEFTDYQCSVCKNNFEQNYPQLKKDYIDTGKILYVVKNYPIISTHPEAEKAAESALCVGEQLGDEGYFKMHDLLFSNQQSLGVGQEKDLARGLGVNGNTFDNCLDSGKYAQYIQNDANYAQQIGVQGVPTFFINGQMLVGIQSYSSFKQLIDTELNK